MCLAIALSMSSAMAQSPREIYYPVMGVVTQIKGNKIVVNDRVVKVLPTLKVRLKNNTLGQFSDVKVGQLVGMSLVTINSRRLVDTITILPDRIKKRKL